MPFVSNLHRSQITKRGATSEAFVAWPMVDTLYDYLQILTDAPIATVPKALWGTKVAIVGAGAAGMVAAYELFRAGLQPVIFEATDRIGGRNYSRYFMDGDKPSNVIAEMGAMRVPVSNKVFYHYADAFGFKYSSFPDPGKVPTVLYYENQRYDWTPEKPAPGPFAQIADDFNNFVKGITTPIWRPWEKGDLEGVRQVWQRYIDQYRDVSFLTALTQGIPSWGPAELNAFGALGMGSGGFGPLYGVGFLEMLRVIVNQWEVDQQLMQFGINDLTMSFYTSKVKLPNGAIASLDETEALRLNTAVTRIGYDGTNPVIESTGPKGKLREVFDAVVVATTSHAMEFMGLTLPAAGGDLLRQEVKVALRNLPMMNSSKLFIRTKTKFWKDNPQMPQNIQTDELPRGLYCLDYPQTENGVVLISYTWGDDSTKLLASPPAERFATFRRVIETIDPQFAAQLEPVNGEIVNIDWEATGHYFGAFKLDSPGQEPDVQTAYYQFLDVLNPAADKGVYLAGDSMSWAGGWTEGALETGLNAATAAAKRVGAEVPANSPLSQKLSLYNYGGSLVSAPAPIAMPAAGD
jgi:tryptophan 2-monooxygenase